MQRLANRPINRIAVLWPSCVCTEHDQQIHIAVRSNLSASMAAKKNDLFRIKAFNNQLRYSLDRSAVDMGFNGIHKRPLP